MSIYTNFELCLPDDLAGALQLLAQDDGADAAVLAGGTNLIGDMRSRRCQPQRVIGLTRLHELRSIDSTSERVSIGGATTVSDLLASADIAAAAPSLADASRRFAGQMVRNVATVAGNIACGSPAADLIPPLMSLDAELTLSCKSGTRQVPIDQFFLGYKKDVRRRDELITSVSWPRLPSNSSNVFYKLARRQGDAITITGVAVTLCVTQGKCVKVRIALGSVGPTVVRAKMAEAMLEDQALTPAMIAAAALQAVSECNPIDDVRASAEYRRHTVEVITRRLVSQAWEKLSNIGEAA